MSARIAGKAVILFICLSLFSTCGEIDSLFPVRENYQVKTLINGTSLEECSIVRTNDRIRPYFAVSVVNDPDLIGLSVYLQNLQGEIIGDKVRYTLLAYADETALMETDFMEVMEEAETEAEAEAEAEQISETVSAEFETFEDVESSEFSELEGEFVEDETALEPPEYEIPQESWPLIEAAPVASYTDVQNVPEIEVAVASLAEELPYFILPKDLAIGPYTLVFEALGQREILSRTETNILYLGSAEFNLKDISMYLPGPSGSQLISPGRTVMLEARLDSDKRLDPYVIWYSGKNIIREGRISDGAGNILWTAPEQVGFYSLRMEAFPFYVVKRRNNFIGLSREITLPVSPKALSLGYFFENTQKYPARSPLSAGTVYPEQVQLIEAMIAAEASVDNTEEKSTLIPPSPPELFQWYQFEGNLRDTVLQLTGRQTLTPANEYSPRWAAAGQSYGLSTGPDDPYLFSPINFFRNRKEEGGGILLLHVKPPTEGVILNAFFPLRSSSADGVWVDLIKDKSITALRLRAEGVTVEIPVYFAAFRTEGFAPIVIEFYIRPYRLEAKISLSDNLHSRTGEIRLSGALSGEGIIRLGGSLANSRLEYTPTTLPPVVSTPNITDQSEEILFEMITAAESAEEVNIPAVVETFTSSTIWDELAILLSTVPLLPEELPEETIIEQDTAVNADDGASVNVEITEKKPDASPSPAPAVQHREAGADTKPATAEIPVSDTPVENNLTKAADEEPVKDEDADTNDSIKEQETQEHITLTVLSEDS